MPKPLNPAQQPKSLPPRGGGNVKKKPCAFCMEMRRKAINAVRTILRKK